MNTTQRFDSWVTCPKPNPEASLRLFCFPYAGGSSLIFRTWVNSLPKSVEICPVELPGRGTQMKLPLFTRMEPLVKAIAPHPSTIFRQALRFLRSQHGWVA
jgi:medium-chain acyl-[acyl-carrier-protein] hydrolase